MKLLYELLARFIVWIVAIYIAVMADPNIILRPNNTDPYRPWVIRVAKIKKKILFWRKYEN